MPSLRFASAVAALALAVSAELLSAQAGITPAQQSRDSAEVHALWRRYLVSRDPIDWAEAERRRSPVFDLASFYTDGSEILGFDVDTAPGTRGAEYRIRTRLRGAPAPGASRPENITTTVYAVHEAGRWRLSGALQRHTRRWLRDTVGPITYIYPPNYPYNPARGLRAVSFTDSIAAAFGVPKLAPIDYYLAHTFDDLYAIMGIESSVKHGAVGGLAQPVNRRLFSGIPDVGEEYRHELAHLVLAPFFTPQTSHFLEEGVMTWLGGTTGMDLPTATRALARFLAEHPRVTLDSMPAGAGITQPQRYTGAAVLVGMVHDAGGVAAVKRLFSAGVRPVDWRPDVERAIGKPWATIQDDWRRRIVGR